MSRIYSDLRSTAEAILVSILASIIAYFLLEYFLKRPGGVIALVVFVLVLLASTLFLSELAQRGRTLCASIKRLRVILMNHHDDATIYRSFFGLDSSRLRIVYTCRTHIDGAACPPSSTLKHVIEEHIPVDEFLTQHLLIQWSMPALLQEGHEALSKRFTCTSSLTGYNPPGEAESEHTRSELPDFIFDDVVVIGENPCANLFLKRLRPVLNFNPTFKYVSSGPRSSARFGSRVHIDLKYSPVGGNTVDKTDRLRLATRFDPGDQNAVAMVCYAPNPFNLRRRILLLYGCHRVGQYLLENWLHSPLATQLLRRLLKNPPLPSTGESQLFGQIALSAPFEPVGELGAEGYRFETINMARNSSLGGLPFFPFRVTTNDIERNGFKIDEAAARNDPMVDISLVVKLKQHDPDLCEHIESHFLQGLPCLERQCWERGDKSVGLHVTLFEFSTHQSHSTLVEGKRAFESAKAQLRSHIVQMKSTKLVLSGCEVFPKAILVYVELADAFVDAVGDACRQVDSMDGYFNMMRTPFPLHCTLVRFTKKLEKEEQDGIQLFVSSHAKELFGSLEIKCLSLLFAEKKPYNVADGEDYPLASL